MGNSQSSTYPPNDVLDIANLIPTSQNVELKMREGCTSLCLAITDNRLITVINHRTRRVLHTFSVKDRDQQEFIVKSVFFSKESIYVAIGTSNGNVHMFNLLTKILSVSVVTHDCAITALSIGATSMPSKYQVVSCSSDGCIFKYNFFENQVSNLMIDKGVGGIVSAVLITNHGQDIVLAYMGGRIVLLAYQEKPTIKTLGGDLIAIVSLANHHVLCASSDGIVSQIAMRGNHSSIIHNSHCNSKITALAASNNITVIGFSSGHVLIIMGLITWRYDVGTSVKDITITEKIIFISTVASVFLINDHC